MKKYLFLFLIISVIRIGYSQSTGEVRYITEPPKVSLACVAEEEAKKIHSVLYPGEAFDPYMEDEYIWYVDGKMTMVLFEIVSDEGFLIMGLHDKSHSVVAFSFDNGLDMDDMPDALKLLLDEYSALIASGDWHPNEISGAGNTEQITANSITPLLTSSWDQRCYYNDSCPPDQNSPAYFCGKAPAGCVATTLGQIVNYFEYPVNGVGNKTYYDATYGNLSANFAGTTYDYQSMPDAIYSANADIAQLLFHLGVATEMDYSASVSGTGAQDALNALKNHFDYSTNAQLVYKINYNNQSWKNLLINELDSGRPIFYGGLDINGGGGHAWVCDGYYGSDYFHMNWGWSGNGDGYFTINNLNPLGGANYINLQEVIIGIKPAQNVLRAEFTADKIIVNPNEVISLSSISQGSPTNYYWEFINTDHWFTSKDITVAFQEPGLIDVKLIVSRGPNEIDSIIKENYISVMPIADFTLDRSVVEINDPVTFTNASLFDNSISNNYSWVFFGADQKYHSGNGPIVSIYSNPGQYSALLGVSSSLNIGAKHFEYKPGIVKVYTNCDTMLNYYLPGYDLQTNNTPGFTYNIEDLDGLTPYHTPWISSGWDIFDEVIGNDTNYFISATSLFQTSGQANNWYSLGPVSIPVGGAVLSWKHKYPDHTKRDGYEVLINETGINSSNFTQNPVFTLSDNAPETLGDSNWTRYEVRLDSIQYGGKDIYIAFHHYADNMFYIALDDIQVSKCYGMPKKVDFYSLDTAKWWPHSVKLYDYSSGDVVAWQWHLPGSNVTYSQDQHPEVNYPQLNAFYDVTLTVTYADGTQKSLTKLDYIQVLDIGVDEIEESSNLIFPNPFNDMITILSAGETYFEIYSVSGRLLVQGTFFDQTQVITSELSIGTYILRLRNSDGSTTSKLLIKSY